VAAGVASGADNVVQHAAGVRTPTSAARPKRLPGAALIAPLPGAHQRTQATGTAAMSLAATAMLRMVARVLVARSAVPPSVENIFCIAKGVGSDDASGVGYVPWCPETPTVIAFAGGASTGCYTLYARRCFSGPKAWAAVLAAYSIVNVERIVPGGMYGPVSLDDRHAFLAVCALYHMGLLHPDVQEGPLSHLPVLLLSAKTLATRVTALDVVRKLVQRGSECAVMTPPWLLACIRSQDELAWPKPGHLCLPPSYWHRHYFMHVLGDKGARDAVLLALGSPAARLSGVTHPLAMVVFGFLHRLGLLGPAAAASLAERGTLERAGPSGTLLEVDSHPVVADVGQVARALEANMHLKELVEIWQPLAKTCFRNAVEQAWMDRHLSALFRASFVGDRQDWQAKRALTALWQALQPSLRRLDVLPPPVWLGEQGKVLRETRGSCRVLSRPAPTAVVGAGLVSPLCAFVQGAVCHPVWVERVSPFLTAGSALLVLHVLFDRGYVGGSSWLECVHDVGRGLHRLSLVPAQGVEDYILDGVLAEVARRHGECTRATARLDGMKHLTVRRGLQTCFVHSVQGGKYPVWMCFQSLLLAHLADAYTALLLRQLMGMRTNADTMVRFTLKETAYGLALLRRLGILDLCTASILYHEASFQEALLFRRPLPVYVVDAPTLLSAAVRLSVHELRTVWSPAATGALGTSISRFRDLMTSLWQHDRLPAPDVV
jgi:hypothetical protein